MKHEAVVPRKRKAVNLSLDTGVVATARELGLNLSQICEAALRDATQDARDRRWQDENQAWADSVNSWIEKNGLPLERYRLF